jgi:hypothetical protein
VLIYSYLTSGIVLPAVKVAVNQLDAEWVGLWMPALIMRWLYVGWENSQPSSSSPVLGDSVTKMAVAMQSSRADGDDQSVHGRFPVHKDSGEQTAITNTVETNSSIGNDSSNGNDSISTTEAVSPHTNATTVVDDVKAPGVLSGARLVDKMLLNATVMSTFGLACPLLLLCVVMDGLSAMCMYRLELRWFLQRKACAGGVSLLAAACKAVEKAAETARVGYRSAMLMSVVVIGAFWALFLYDMIADVYGSFAGGLVVLAPTVGGLVVYGFFSIPVPGAVVRQLTMRVELQSMSNPVLEDKLDLKNAL